MSKWQMFRRAIVCALALVLAWGGMPVPALAEMSNELEAMEEGLTSGGQQPANKEVDVDKGVSSEAVEEDGNQTIPLATMEEAPQVPQSPSQENKLPSGPTGATPIRIDVPSVHNANEKTEGRLVAQSDLPSKYDSRDKGLVTALKVQDPFGTCWSFTTLAALESSLLAHNPSLTASDLDLSERHLSYFTFHQQDDALKNITGDATTPKGLTYGNGFAFQSDPYLIAGGNFYIAACSLASWAGPVNESDAPYAELLSKTYDYGEAEQYDIGYRKIKDPEKGDAYLQATALEPSLARSKNVAWLTGMRMISMKDTDDVKSAIMENGGVAVAINDNEKYRSFASDGTAYVHFVYDYEPGTTITHTVEVVGWDNNFSRLHFGKHQFMPKCTQDPPSTHVAIEELDTSVSSPTGQDKNAWFSYTPESDGVYCVALQNGTNPWVYVLDSANGKIGSCRRMTGSNSKQCDVEMLAGRTYYIQAYANSNDSETVTLTRVGDIDFTDVPEHDGAWLAKNSWSLGDQAQVGNAGYVWISYDDQSNIDKKSAGVLLASTEQPSDNIYQYDGGTSETWNYIESGGSVANVFTAKANNGGIEKLKAVGLHVNDVNVDYEVQVYLNPTKSTDPTSGTPMLREPLRGSTNYLGYYTVDLSQPLTLIGGDRYAVVATYSHSDNTRVGYSVDANWEVNSFIQTSVVAPGQSFEKDSSSAAWNDLATAAPDEGDEPACCVRIKAFTDNAEAGEKLDLAQAEVSAIGSQPYTGNQIRPGSITVTLGGRVLKLDTDYILEYGENVQIGENTGSVTVLPANDLFTGSKSVTFTIREANWEDATASVDGWRYDTEEHVAVPKVVLVGRELVAGTDYEVEGDLRAKDAGTYSISVSPKGAYTGNPKTVEYVVAPAAITSVVASPSTYTYDGKAKQPGVTVMAGQLTVPTEDRTLTWANNTNAGTATVTATGKGNYTGSQSTTFKIERTKVAVPKATNRTYTGAAQVGVAAGVGYKLSGTAKATNAGTYKATATPDANHRWSDGTTAAKTLTWKIAPASVAKAAVAKIANQPYTGKAVTPRPAVKVGGRTLALNKDYTLSYKNNTKAGTATVSVKGKGNYAGTKSTTFRIVAPSVRYCTHVQSIGDQAWRYNGQPSGTFGKAKRLEGIWILVLPKGSKAPAANYGGYKQMTATPFKQG